MLISSIGERFRSSSNIGNGHCPEASELVRKEQQSWYQERRPMWSNRSPFYLNVWIPWVFPSLIRKLFEPFVFSHYFLSSERKYAGHIRFQDESTNAPNETLLYFTDYFNTCWAVYPGGNVLFPPVKTKVKNCQDGCAEK